MREFASDFNRGVSSQIARLCTRAPAKPALERSSAPRCHFLQQAAFHRPRPYRCRLAVLPRDQLDSQALLGVAEQQTLRLLAHNTNPADGDRWG